MAEVDGRGSEAGGPALAAEIDGGGGRTHALGQRARFGSIEGEIVEFTPTSVILSTLEGRVHVPASQFDEQASMLLSPDGRHA